MNTSNLISITETAGLLGLCKKTVYRLANSGEIPAKRYGRKWFVDKNTLLGISSNSAFNEEPLKAKRELPST